MNTTPFTPEPLFVHDNTAIATSGPRKGRLTGTFDITNRPTLGEGYKWIGDTKPYSDGFPDLDEAKAYAKLFAASPDLLECLKDCIENVLIDLPDDDPRKVKYKAAIAKATA